MDFKNMKVSIGIVIAIVAQAFGIIWYVAQLDSTVSNLDSTVSVMQESQATVDVAVLQTEVNNLIEKVAKLSEQEEVDLSDIEQSVTELDTALELISDRVTEEREIRNTTLDEIQDSLEELEKTQAVIDNEMRTIMSDHGGFAEVLKQINAAGLLPSGEKRQYGSYGQ